LRHCHEGVLRCSPPGPAFRVSGARGPTDLAGVCPTLCKGAEERRPRYGGYCGSRVASRNAEFLSVVRDDLAARRLTTIPGIGALNATALIAAIGNLHRRLAACPVHTRHRANDQILRISACPAFETRSSRSLPPDKNCRGTSPSHAAKSRRRSSLSRERMPRRPEQSLGRHPVRRLEFRLLVSETSARAWRYYSTEPS